MNSATISTVTTQVHGRKYRYHRHGLLDDIPHRKIGKGVIIIRSEDLERVKEYVRDKVEDIHIRIVELNVDDIDILEGKNRATSP
ncbi:hypothetical protein B1A_06922 [mine drainage metagenome]|uniref:Uncharacterized protein n=1 Tax=mine drainage metagenome TaxID=410659 RepID=T1BLN2_9ZZZZ